MTELRLRLAGLGVRLRHDDLPYLAPAFDHLVSGDAGEDLVITVVRAAAPAGGENFGDGSRYFLDLAHGRATVHLVDDVPGWATASPLRTLLARFLTSRGRFLAHAAAIGDARGAVLVAAKGGSGKSTCALACLPRFAVAGDDFVIVEPGVGVHALYGTAKVAHAQATRFPHLARVEARDKTVMRIPVAPFLRLRAVAVPTLTPGAPSRVEPITHREALLALAPSSLFLVPGAGAETLDALTTLVASLPAYRLCLGSDLTRIPDAIEDLCVAEIHDPPEAVLGVPLMRGAEISVLVPVHDGARFLAAALESALAQTLPPAEIIVVDDGSQDASAEIAARYARVLRQENRGPAAARNVAAAAARCGLFAFLDADDLWHPAKLERQAAALAADPGLGWMVCKHHILLDEGVERPHWAPNPEQEARMTAWLPSATLVTRACFAATRGFDETLRYGEDLDWFARARDAGFRGGALEEPLLTRRVHRTNMMHAHTQADFQRAIATIIQRRRRR